MTFDISIRKDSDRAVNLSIKNRPANQKKLEVKEH